MKIEKYAMPIVENIYTETAGHAHRRCNGKYLMIHFYLASPM